MWNKLMKLIAGKDYALRERMLRIIILCGGIATIVGITECLFVMEVTTLLIPLLFLVLLVIGISFYVAFKYRKYEAAAILIAIVVVGMVFPAAFFISGGLVGGPSVWLTLGIVYLFVMFRGKKLVFFVMLSCAVFAGTYGVAYFHPEFIQPLPDELAAYLDSYFSVVVVGLVAGMILKMHMQVFEAEHELNLEQKKELEKSRDAQGAFFANMSHEIRSPINTVIGLNEMILRNSHEEEIIEYAKNIERASKMLLNQVNDILDISQMEMEKMKIVPVQYKPADMFVDLVNLIRIQRERKNLELYLDIDSKLPSVLMGDEKRLKQILLNILDNAVKYTDEGSISLSAHGEMIGTDEVLLKVTVADTGIGIRKEDMEHLYDAFNRVDEGSNSKITGSGLGLAITKQLISMMDGEITVDSIYTKGSVFTVSVKQKIVDNRPMGAFRKQDTGEGSGSQYVPSFEAPEARILVVDDNKMNSFVASKLLAATKVQIDVAGSGSQCLEMTQKKYYHVILMDYMMPEMNGLETMEALRKQENGLCRESAVIALTGNAMSGAREMCLAQGFDGYLEKPIQGKALEQGVLQFLPGDIIEHIEHKSMEAEGISIQKFVQKKRKKVCITTECACDIPRELLDKYDIYLLYLYIRTPGGRFADTREIDASSLNEYLTPNGSTVFVENGTVEEYEEFFAHALTRAEQVIHISLAAGVSASYNCAVTAAKCFDHVQVIDSEQVSCGLALLVLHAAKMASDGYLAKDICEEIEKAKHHIRAGYILPRAEILYQRGRVSAFSAKLCRAFQLRPVLTVNQKKVTISRVLAGTREKAWKQGIRRQLRKRRRICADVIYVVHVNCNVSEQEWIKAEIQKIIPVKRIIMQQASFANACNCGPESIGISYYSI